MPGDKDELLKALGNNDAKKAKELSEQLKNGLSEDKKQMLEHALGDRQYLKSLLSSPEAAKAVEELKKRGII